MADPKDQEREQAAREWLAKEIDSYYEFSAMGEVGEALVSLLRTREESAYKRGQEASNKECRKVLINFMDRFPENVLFPNVLETIRALPVRGMEE